MNIEILTALCTFAFVTSVTPGPNNLMLMSSGANFGIRRSLPHLFGVTFGFVFMLILVGIGLMQVFDLYPLTYELLRLFSVAYLLYLAWKISNARPSAERASGSPIGSLQAALFQWVNPKAWAMALTTISVYTPASHPLHSIILVATIYLLINLPSNGSWILLGTQLRRFLDDPLKLRCFNVTAAVLLVGSLYPILLGEAI